jgi:hypothetical protein
MKLPTCLLPFALLATATAAQPTPAPAAIPSKEVQIKAALQAAAPQFRDGAMVYGYDERGQFVVLRPGTNKLICLADDPAMKGFSAACYHQDLEPFMARGRALRKEGKSMKEVFTIRETEVKSGKLPMPTGASTLAVLGATEENYDRTTGEVKAPLRHLHSLRHVGEHRPAPEAGNARRPVDHGSRHPPRAHHAESDDVRATDSIKL